MESISGTSLTAFSKSKAVFELRPERQHHAKENRRSDDSEHFKQSTKGRKRAVHIFRQEVMYRFKMKFAAHFSSKSEPVNAYRDGGTPEDTAGQVLDEATKIVDQNQDDQPQVLGRIRESVDQAVSASREALDGDDEADALKETEGLVKNGLDTLEKNTALTRSSSIEIDAVSKQRSTIQIRTQEGDVVSFDLRRVERLSVSDTAIEDDSISASKTEIFASSRSRLVLRVNGDINDAERAAIQSVFDTAEDLAAEFFAGDMEAALEIAAGLQFDSEQLARVSMRFRSVERFDAMQRVEQSGPAAVPVEDASQPTPVLTNPGDVSDSTAPAVPADDAVKPTPALTNPDDAADSMAPAEGTGEVQTPAVSYPETTDPVVVDAPDNTGTSGGFLAGFESFANFLSKIADYLEQTAEQFRDAMRANASTGKIRFEMTESLQIEILRAVMTVSAPEQANPEEKTSGDLVQLLEEQSEQDEG